MLSNIVEPTDRTDDHATHGHQFDHQSITAHPQCSMVHELQIIIRISSYQLSQNVLHEKDFTEIT